MKQLTGKRIWITGASSGIGAATATLLAAAGAEVILSARRVDRIGSLAKSIEAAGGVALVRPLDVTVRADVDLIGSEMAARGGVHVLINNAGVMPLAPMIDGRVEEWDRMIDINVKGLLYTTRAVFADMAARREGHIVNIGSVASQFAFAGGAVYSGTKFAVRGISDGLRREALAFGVRVTTIQPGAVATELVDTIQHEGLKAAVTSAGSFYAPEAQILSEQDVASSVLYAISQPSHVNVAEILLRPTCQEF